MPDFILITRLVIQLFSVKRESTHFPSKKRLVSAFLVLPLLSIQILINQIFLLLDNVFFFFYRFKKVGKSTFIVGAPRSGTTYMYDLMARDEENFTCFKLWELLFAPSIIQKYLCLGIIKVDRVIGKPLYKMSLWLDKIILGKFNAIHRMGLSLPEEDEMLMVYDYSSTYLFYFFPEAKEMRPYIFFDEDLSEKKRIRIMKYYYRCVQRHQFVFNRKRNKIYLSKNPSFISKTVSLSQTFEDCNIVYMLRTPLKTIPATISLNDAILRGFSKVLPSKEREEETRDTILRWYNMSLNQMDVLSAEKKTIIPFIPFVTDPVSQIARVYKNAKLQGVSLPTNNQKQFIEEHKNYKSGHKYNLDAGLDSKQEEIQQLEERINIILDDVA